MSFRSVFSVIVVACVPGLASEFYVAPTGSAAGDGSIAKPWDFQGALNQPRAVKPGDTIWIRGGTYGNGRIIYYSRLVGTSAAPIVVRRYKEERAIVNG